MNNKMQADDIVTKILTEANQEAQKIAQKSQQELLSQEAKRTERLAAYTSETETLERQAADDKKMRMLASARMEISRQILTEKRAMLEKVFLAAQQRLESMPKEEYEKLCIVLIKNAHIGGNEEIVVGSKETRIDAHTADRINRELGGKGFLQLGSRKGDFEYGFALDSGNMRFNSSLETLINEIRNDHEIEIANILFEQ